MTQESDLFGVRPARRPQQRWIDAAARRAAARAAFDALPQAERDAVWARVDRLLFVEATFRIAATMPGNPHAYCHRRNFNVDDDFRFLITFLRSGVCDREKYDGRWYDTLNRAHPVSGEPVKFWCMGWPLDTRDGGWLTVIINRKPARLVTDDQ